MTGEIVKFQKPCVYPWGSLSIYIDWCIRTTCSTTLQKREVRQINVIAEQFQVNAVLHTAVAEPTTTAQGHYFLLKEICGKMNWPWQFL